MDSEKSTPVPQRASSGAIASKVTPEGAFYFSKSAYDNASRLLDAAVMLHAHGHYGPARSTAISAREEFGKFLAALLHCAGVYDAQRFADVLRKHSSKQMLGATLALLGGPLRSMSRHLEPAIKVEGETMREAFDLMAANLQAALPKVPMPNEQEIAEMQVVLAQAHSGGDDARRTEGLYVDLIDNGSELGIRSPGDVTAAQALEEIQTAQAYVDWVGPLVKAITIAEIDEGSTLTIQEVIAELRRFVSMVLPPPEFGGGDATQR